MEKRYMENKVCPFCNAEIATDAKKCKKEG